MAPTSSRHHAHPHTDTRTGTDLIRSISDPEHPLTLEQLAVVSAPQITVRQGARPSVLVEFTPTIPHCSMATLIGASRPSSPFLCDDRSPDWASWDDAQACPSA